MDGRMFDGMIAGLLLMGAGIGLALAGIVYFLFSHITVAFK